MRLLCLTPAAPVHGVGAEEGLHQRPPGAQPHPARRHTPEGGAGGEPEELPEEGRPPGAAGGVAEGQGARRHRPLLRRGGGKHSGLSSVPQEELGVMQTQIFQLDAQRAQQEGDASKQRER